VIALIPYSISNVVRGLTSIGLVPFQEAIEVVKLSLSFAISKNSVND
jgi:hypothetical protein